jgi:hypothetical protein
MVGGQINASDPARLVARYKQLRQVGWDLNNKVLPKYLPTPGIEACAKKLGLWHKGELVLEQEDEIGVLMDCCIHDFRPKPGTAGRRRACG